MFIVPDPFARNGAAGAPQRAAIPSAAAWLTGLGIIPFPFLALLATEAAPWAADHARMALLVYGAVILSFIGGIRWGFALAPGVYGLAGQGLWPALASGVAPSLLGWLALLLPATYAEWVLAAGFAAMLVCDCRLIRRGEAPAWYGRLRWPPTLAAVASLLASALI